MICNRRNIPSQSVYFFIIIPNRFKSRVKWMHIHLLLLTFYPSQDLLEASLKHHNWSCNT